MCDVLSLFRHVGLLYIKGTTFKMEPIPLCTVRPFVLDTVVLSQTGIDPRQEEEVVSYLVEKVRNAQPPSHHSLL